MKLTVIQTLIIILAIAVGTQISRWLPFLAFSGKKETPAFIKIPRPRAAASTHGSARCLLL